MAVLDHEARVSVTHSAREARREREREQRRGDVIAGATRVFAARGYDGAQMTEIAAAAGLSLASLYAMFEGKASIFRHVMVSAVDDMQLSVRTAVEQVEDPGERLLRLIDALLACFEENRDLLRLTASGTSGMPWRLRAGMLQSSGDLLDSFEAWVVALARDVARAGRLEGIEPEAMAEAIVGSTMHAASRALARGSSGSIAGAAADIREIFSRVLAADKGDPE